MPRSKVGGRRHAPLWSSGVPEIFTVYIFCQIIFKIDFDKVINMCYSLAPASRADAYTHKSRQR